MTGASHPEEMSPGPYVPAVGRCTWCEAVITFDPDRDQWLDDAGQRCSPQARGATCVWGAVQLHGLHPLDYPGHHLFCACQATIGHHPAISTSYPFPDRVVWHCDQPALLTRTAWMCRACPWSVPVDPTVHPPPPPPVRTMSQADGDMPSAATTSASRG